MSSNRRAFFSILLLALALGSAAEPLPACSVFQLGGGGDAVVGYSFDWFKPLAASAFVNPRGRAKTALAPGGDQPARWTSSYGSVTFSGFGREFPFCGMNEAGLIVAQAWLGPTGYPEIDSRPSLSELQWIQYQLDTAATVQDVIASDQQVRISINTLAPLHFFVSDRSGGTAVIEFLDGRLVPSTGDRMPIRVMVNAPYQASLAGYDPEAVPETGDRFATGASRIHDWRPDEHSPTAWSFSTLDKLQQDGTRWAVVFDRASGEIHYRVAGGERFSSFAVEDLDYGCGSPEIQHVLVDAPSDAAPRFTAYQASATRAMVLANGANLPGSDPQAFELMAAYSEAAGCGGVTPRQP